MLVVAAVLTGQLSIGWSNDLIDRARDRAVGRTDKPLATGALVPRRRRACASPSSLTVVALAGLRAGRRRRAPGLRRAPAGPTTSGSRPPSGRGCRTPWRSVASRFRRPGRPAPACRRWLPVAGALLGVGAHLLNVLPDLDDDAATGVRGLPHRLGARWLPAVAAAVLGAGLGRDRGRHARSGVLPAVAVAASWSVALAVGGAGRAAVGTPFRGRDRDRAGGRGAARGVPDDAPSGRWDLVVVGAGPAGAAAALGALMPSPGLRVLLLDRTDFPRDKCCGDGIAPHVFDALAAVGAARRRSTAGRRCATWSSPAATTRVAGTMARPVYVIPRAVFDARLVERAVAAGAVLARHRVSSLTPPRRRGRARRPGHGAGVVVGADGAHSVVRVRRARRRRAAARARDPRLRAHRRRATRHPGDPLRRPAASRRTPGPSTAATGSSNVGYGELLPARGADDRRRPGRYCSTSSSELIPGAGDGATDWRGHHLPLSSAGAGTSPTDRCCWSATRPDWSTR